ncbi:MAG TPA: photosynthetic reaction center cytochrome c subunit family protein [Bryobacteraceae bacterium]|jgi:photosynthetic reaction center cytochrome c subunit|nr:photosynthetic reaction center cytochrome c subunit family protein [Bryobacteraceae bacterium]
MKFWSRRLALAAAGIMVAGLTLASQAAAQEKPKTAGEVFKNVTTSTLKGITVDEFMGSMGVMAAALGWDCSDCHAGAGTDKVVWEADTPRKVLARKMTEMVAVINKSNFGGAPMVSCWTCHHGRDIPATTIALDNLYGAPNDEKDDIIAADPQPQVSATAIIDKYIEALGGAQKLAGLKSFIATGTQEGYVDVKGGGVFQIFAKAPDQRTVQIRFPDAPDRGDQTRSFNGKIGWVTTPRALLGEYEVTGTELDGQKLDAELSFPGQIKQVLTDLKVGYPDSINGKEVQVVQGRGPRNLLATLYFDKQTGLLVRLLRFGRSPIGRVPTQVDYADYRDVNGIKFPFKYKFSWLDGRDSFTLTKVETNVPVDESKFGKPSLGK